MVRRDPPLTLQGWTRCRVNPRSIRENNAGPVGTQFPGRSLGLRSAFPATPGPIVQEFALPFTCHSSRHPCVGKSLCL